MEQAKRVTRRDFLRWSTMAATIGALASCAPKTVEVEKVVKETVEVQKEIEKQVTVFAEKPEVRFMSDPSPAELKLMVPLLDAFQDDTGIRIKLEAVPGGTEKLITALAAGTAPDVFGNWGPGMRMLIEKGTCLNLDPFIESDLSKEDLDDYVESQLEAATWQDHKYALPQYCGIWAGFYNKRILDEEGLAYPDKESWDYQTYLDYAIRTTKRDENGIPSQLGVDEWYGFEFTVATNIWCWGGEVHDPEDNRICRLGEPKALEAMQWHADFRWKWKVAGTNAENSAINNAGGGNGLFGSDRVAMKPEGSWGVKGFVEAAKGRFDWGVMPHHRGPTGDRVTFSTTDVWMINAKSPVLDASWKWLKYVSGPDYQRMRIQANGAQPCRKSVAKEWVTWATDYAKQANPDADQDFSVFIEGFDYCRPMVYFHNHTEAMEILQPALDQVYTTGTATAEEVMPEACQKITDLLTQGA